MSSISYEKVAVAEGGGYAPVDVGGRRPYLHPATEEGLPEKGKPSRLWGSQRAYLRHLVDTLPDKLKAGGEDAALRQLIDAAMRAEFGDAYEERCRQFAAEEAARLAPEPPPVKRPKKGMG